MDDTLSGMWKRCEKLEAERDELQEKLKVAIHTISIYANDKNWHKTSCLTEWILNPNASLLAKEALKKLEAL